MKGFFFYFILFAYVLIGLYVTNDHVEKPNLERLAFQTSLRSLMNFRNLRGAFMFAKLNQIASSFRQRVRRDLNSFSTMEKYPVYHPVIFQVLFKLQNYLLVARNPFESFSVQRYYFPSRSKPIKYNLENYQYSAVPDPRESFKQTFPMCNRIKIISLTKRVPQWKSKAAIHFASYQFSAIPDPRHCFKLKFEFCLPSKQNTKFVTPKINSKSQRWSQIVSNVQVFLKSSKNVFNNFVMQAKIHSQAYLKIKMVNINKHQSPVLNDLSLRIGLPKKHNLVGKKQIGFQLKSKGIYLESYQYSAVLDPRNVFNLKFEFCLPRKQYVKYATPKTNPKRERQSQRISKVPLFIKLSKNIFSNKIAQVETYFRCLLRTQKYKMENHKFSVLINQLLPMFMQRNGYSVNKHIPGFQLKAKVLNLESYQYSALPNPCDSFKLKFEFCLPRKQNVKHVLAKFHPKPSIKHSSWSQLKLKAQKFIKSSWELVKNVLPEKRIRRPLFLNAKKYNLEDYQYSAVLSPNDFFKRSFPMCGQWMKRKVMKPNSVPRSKSKTHDIQSYQYSVIPNINDAFKLKFEYCLNKNRKLKLFKKY